MIPELFNNFGTEKIADLSTIIKGIAIEERNGMCEIEVIYPLFSPGWQEISSRGNIIVADLNDTIKSQMFRIYKASKPINGKISVYAKHIFFDLAKDFIEKINIEKQSCEYCLNQIFKNSQFSQKFKGYSDVINAQNYNIESINPAQAIGGTQGSILDTFGTGAELKLDNYNVYVLNKRGHDNEVTIEYSKNLTGFNLDFDDSNLITSIRAYAKYNNEENEEVVVYSNPKYINSPLIDTYETPFIKDIDFSDKFKDNEVPTTAKLKLLAENYFIETKCDQVKTTFKIEFIPLSKCLGYENIQDKISLCDTVTIKDYRYKINTKAKVIKTKYNFLSEMYESIELGDAKTTLGDLVNNKPTTGPQGTPGKNGTQGPPGKDGEEFPDTLPQIPTLNANLKGFASVDLSWSFENKVYYSYQLFASKDGISSPNTFDLIFEGQGSSFLHTVKPGETWYYWVRAINSYGKATGLSTKLSITTNKKNDFEDYFSTLAVENLVANIFSVDYMEAGIIKANWIDARNLSVTDGNGKRTLNIDSFGNVNLDVTSLKISSRKAATENFVEDEISTSENKTDEKIKNAEERISMKVEDIITETNKGNVIVNGTPQDDSYAPWLKVGESSIRVTNLAGDIKCYSLQSFSDDNLAENGFEQAFSGFSNEPYTLKFKIAPSSGGNLLCAKIKSLASDGKFYVSDTFTISSPQGSTFHQVEFSGELDGENHKLYIGTSKKAYYSFSIYDIQLITKAGSAVSKEEFAELKITTKGIETNVKSVDSRLGTAESTIKQQANQIATKVDVNGVKSTIEQNPTSVMVGFNEINNNFEITPTNVHMRAENGNNSLRFSYGKMYTHNSENGAETGWFGTGKWINTNTYGLCLNQKNGTFNSFGELASLGDVYTSKFAINYGGIPNFGLGINCFSDLNLNNHNVVGDLNLSTGSTARIDKLNNRSNPSDANGYINSYSNINMNNWKITNAQIKALSLEESVINFNKSNLESIVRANKNLDNVISYSNKTKINNGSCTIELPGGYPVASYEVFLQPIGRNVVYLMEELDDSFIVEADNDCEFNYRIEIKLAEIERYNCIKGIIGDEEIEPEEVIIPVDHINEFWELYKK